MNNLLEKMFMETSFDKNLKVNTVNVDRSNEYVDVSIVFKVIDTNHTLKFYQSSNLIKTTGWCHLECKEDNINKNKGVLHALLFQKMNLTMSYKEKYESLIDSKVSLILNEYLTICAKDFVTKKSKDRNNNIYKYVVCSRQVDWLDEYLEVTKKFKLYDSE